MRASHIALIATVLAIPSVGYAQQDNEPVGGMVGPDGLSSLGPSSGPITPGQFAPQNVHITPQDSGMGSAWINGHRVLVDPNTNRILRVFN